MRILRMSRTALRQRAKAMEAGLRRAMALLQASDRAPLTTLPARAGPTPATIGDKLAVGRPSMGLALRHEMTFVCTSSSRGSPPTVDSSPLEIMGTTRN
mmetsp:Transcript_51914/g.92467  ORF Transcript_51914/g.92467 Transcript_51914/m.92467 type:complete len:99 (-) Transcript_51914:660-956(-)